MKKSSFIFIEVKRAYLDSAEELWYLINKQTQDILPLTVIHAIERRNEVASGTIENEIRAVALLYEHAFRQRFELDSFLTLEKNFNAPAFVNFLRSLFVYMQTGRSDENIAGAIYSRIAPATFTGYWNSIRDYVKRWIGRSLIVSGRSENEEGLIKIHKEILYLEDKFSQFVSKVPPKLHLSILRDDSLNKVIRAFHPSSNLFKDQLVKWRNWSIFLLLLDSGMRIGELLSMYVSDTPRGGNTIINIERRPDDPADPRKRRPHVKSSSRKIAVSRRTIDAVNYYLITYRSDHAGMTHLFLNDENSKPVAYSTIKAAFERVSEQTKVEVYPHMVRHTRHYNRLLELGLENGKDKVCIEGGWSPKAGIPETYTYQYKLDQSNKTSPFFLDALTERVAKNGKDGNR